MTVDRKIVLITGAAAGIGLEAVKALVGSQHASYDILLSARKLAQAQAAAEDITRDFPSAVSIVIPLEIDVSSDKSIEEAADLIQSRYGRIDVLVNNAGLLPDFSVASGQLSLREGWSKAWDINVTSSHVMTHTFAPLLLRSNDPRLLFITSSTSTLVGTENGDLPTNKPSNRGWPKTQMRTMVPSYRCAKTGLNMMMREWHRMLSDDGVKTWAVSPGFLATRLGGDQDANKKMGAGDPALGGGFIKDIIEGTRDGDVGKAITRDGVQPW
ncbi:3-keto-steroid reductase [Beauveria bassiana]|nr:3-keto-steroid reductase [Beauveria bassiana]KAH8710359.1 Short-chain dehydrogenase/reductase tropE [Beauveria bassiana]